jgi:hypothetical protein
MSSQQSGEPESEIVAAGGIARRVHRCQWQDRGSRLKFFLGLTAVWSVAVAVAVAATSLLHFVEVRAACGNSIGERLGGTKADVVFESGSVAIACRDAAGTVEVPMNAPFAGIVFSVFGLALTTVFALVYVVLWKRTVREQRRSRSVS